MNGQQQEKQDTLLMGANIVSRPTCNNLMFDLETLGRRPGDGIIEIGYCTFSDKSVNVTPAKEIFIPIEQSLLYGFNAEEETVKWWLETMQGFRTLRSDTRPHATFPQLLSELASQWNEYWFAGCTELWCNGITLDIDMLRAAYKKLSVELPIILRDENFQHWHDFRTLKKAAELLSLQVLGLGKTFTAHSLLNPHRASADAHQQAFIAAEIFARFSRNLDDSIKVFKLEQTIADERALGRLAREQINKLEKRLKDAKRRSKRR